MTLPSINIKRFYANIGKLVTSSLDIRDVLAGIMIEVELFFKPDHWSIMRYDSSAQELFFIDIQGIDKKLVSNIRLKLGEGVAGSVVKDGKSLFIPDARSDARFSPKVDEASGFVTHSILAAPIAWQGEVYGVIELVNRFDGNSFSEEDLLVLESIADFAGIAFANALMYREARNHSRTDALTGLYNRLKLDEVKEEYLLHAKLIETSGRRRSEDAEKSLVAIFIDLNDFKSINDSHGHKAGDEALRDFAGELRRRLRQGDRIFRVGGDEFLVLIECANSDLGRLAIDRVKSHLTETDFVTPAGLRIRFSLGVSQGAIGEINDLIQEADQRMYEKKGKK